MLFNEPKLLKSNCVGTRNPPLARFSALQRAEIAEICVVAKRPTPRPSFSALQRAEIAEMSVFRPLPRLVARFSALQRAEIAEIIAVALQYRAYIVVSVLFNEPKLLKLSDPSLSRLLTSTVSVLFNEPKLLKSREVSHTPGRSQSFSALQRAEIAEIRRRRLGRGGDGEFQCSSTSRNC